MPLQATSGAASYDAFGGGVPAVPNYIEEVFSTWLYAGNGSTQTITNGVDLSGKGGMVWARTRTQSDTGYTNLIVDTVRGTTKCLFTEKTNPQLTETDRVTAFNSNGFSIGNNYDVNWSGQNYASWTFREQPKFFDVQTYTGNGTAGRTVAHNLGSVPGCMIVKCTSTTNDWAVYHRSLGATYHLKLNTTSTATDSSVYWNSTNPTATEFTVGTPSEVNTNGATYVAYLFAHDAGGFGLTGTDNVISCGSFTTDGSGNATVNLGYEPQWILQKRTNSTISGGWYLLDTMRGFTVGDDNGLFANTSDAETGIGNYLSPTATGFSVTEHNSSSTYIYIAIRRGPMKVPTSGTSVFSPNAYAGTSSAQTQTTNFPVDLFIDKTRNAASDNFVIDRLRGSTPALATNSTGAEDSLLNIGLDSNTGVKFLASQLNGSGSDFILWAFKRAPSFFDAVCYTGTDVAKTITHNLAVVPELMIVKSRIGAASWIVYDALNGATNATLLNLTNASFAASGYWNNTAPTSSVFTVGANGAVNGSGQTYVAYLFSTCAGVSKVGSYTGNGSTQTINCGFGAGGARFVLIKRTDSTGGWYVYDTARGMTLLTDPYLFLNTTAAEAATLGSVTTVSTGFALDSTILAAINVSAGSYIFLAIA